MRAREIWSFFWYIKYWFNSKSYSGTKASCWLQCNCRNGNILSVLTRIITYITIFTHCNTVISAAFVEVQKTFWKQQEIQRFSCRYEKINLKMTKPRKLQAENQVSASQKLDFLLLRKKYFQSDNNDNGYQFAALRMYEVVEKKERSRHCFEHK